MTTRLDLEPPAQRIVALLDGVPDEMLTAPTPCEEYTVADLLDHLIGLAAAFRDAGTKTLGPNTTQGPRVSAANLDPDWRKVLPERLAELAAGWRSPDAWEGETQAGGVTMPAEVMGVVAVDELVLHGWDLARATGQPFECDPASTEAIFQLLSQADPEGAEGMFGPRVEIPEEAPKLDRALAFSGRNPSWTPST